MKPKPCRKCAQHYCCPLQHLQAKIEMLERAVRHLDGENQFNLAMLEMVQRQRDAAQAKLKERK